jgi:hypothetical protein
MHGVDNFIHKTSEQAVEDQRFGDMLSPLQKNYDDSRMLETAIMQYRITTAYRYDWKVLCLKNKYVTTRP